MHEEAADNPAPQVPGSTPEPGSAGRRWLPSLALCALTLATLAVSAEVFRSLLPWPDDAGLGTKLDVYLAHAEDYDILFLGSSRVARGYVPEVIDAGLAARGHELRSYNLGVDAMTSFETDFLLRHVLDQRPERLRYVVVELEAWTPPRSVNPRFGTERSVYWHDTRQTWRSLESISKSQVEAKWKWQEGLENAALWGKRLFNVGRGVRRVEDLVVQPAPTLNADAVHEHRGYQPFDIVGDPKTRQAHNRWLKRDEPKFAAKVEFVRNMPTGDDQLAFFNLQALLDQKRIIEEAGYTPIYAMGPAIKPKPYLRALVRHQVVPVIFDFHRPDVYPELFDPRYRFDDDHLNVEGATAFSATFAEAFAEWLDTGAPPP